MLSIRKSAPTHLTPMHPQLSSPRERSKEMEVSCSSIPTDRGLANVSLEKQMRLNVQGLMRGNACVRENRKEAEKG